MENQKKEKELIEDKVNPFIPYEGVGAGAE